MNRRIMVAGVAILTVALVVTGVWAGFFKGRDSNRNWARLTLATGPAEVTLTPTVTDSVGVDTATSFQVNSAKPLTVAQLQQELTVTPATPLRVEQADQDGKSFKVTPAQLLEPNKVYRFRLAASTGVSRSYQWAFQTRTAFRILGSLPRHQGTGVPVNTGIELTFSHENYGDLDRFFEISPSVEGRFERHKKSVAFVPTRTLAPGTVYTVTVKKGLGQSSGQATLTESFTFSFETEPAVDKGRPNPFFGVPQEPQEFPAEETPHFMVSYYSGKTSSPLGQVDVTVYRYPDAKAYIAALTEADKVPWWASHTRSEYREATTGLARVATFTSEAKEFPNIPGLHMLFPDRMEPGYYLAEFRAQGDSVRHSRFQVTDLSSYLSVTTTKTLVWLNDLATKAPVRGAQVTLAGAAPVTTGDDGVALLPTPAKARETEDRQGLYLHVQAGAKEAVVGVQTFTGYYSSYDAQSDRRSLYWKYLYLDRTLYKPDDKVNLWGVIKEREQGAGPVPEVTVQLVRSEYQGDQNVTLPLATQKLRVEDGTFIGTLALPSLRPGQYEVQVKMGDDYLISRWFEVQTYTKPGYKMALTTSRSAIFAGEQVEFRVQSNFFEGTPVANLQLKYGLSGMRSKEGGESGDLLTGSSGEAVYTYTPELAQNGPPTYPQEYASLQVHSAVPEGGDTAAEAGVTVFARNVLVTPDAEVNKGAATVRVKVNHVDLGRPDDQYKGAPAAGRLVKGAITESRWIAEPDGVYYDFIQKTTHPQYRYHEERQEVGRFEVTTNAEGTVTYPVAVIPDRLYNVKLEVLDTNANWVASELYFQGQEYTYRAGGGYRYFHLTPPEGKWGLDQEIPVLFSENSKPLADRPNSFLFYTARLGLGDHKVQSESTFHYKLRPTDLPNTNVQAVYFDGRSYREAAWAASLQFDSQQRALQVSIQPDKDSYRPGETVNLSIDLRDRQGRPVQGRVNLNLVDEALYALRDEKVDLLGALYGERIAPGILRTRSSHHVPEPGSGAEKGGDGGGARKDFQDAIFFANVATRADGRATASFKVPDNLTSWRLTYQALAAGESVQAASGTMAVPVKLPFFVELTVGESYLTGDTPQVTAYSYGTALNGGESVEYTVKVTGPAGATTESQVRGTAFTPVNIPLPALQSGAYTVRIDGTAPGGQHDALEKTFTAVDSYLRQNRVDFHLLSDKTELRGAAKGLTMLTFADYERGQYLRLLQSMRWQWGNRFEQKLARSVSGALLKQHLNVSDPWSEPELNTLDYQTPVGSIAILPYGDGDLQLSALAADLAPERFDRAALTIYFEQVLADRQTGRDRAVIALYGLAALEQPVLPTVQALSQAADLTVPEQLFLGLAAAELGDLESARSLYYQVLKVHGEEFGASARVKAGRDQAEILSATALTGALAGKLGEGLAPAFAGYLAEAPGQEVLVLLEAGLLAQAGLERLANTEPVAFTYVLDGKQEQRELKPGETFTLPVTPQALSGLQFKEVRGRVGLTVAYDAPLEVGDLKEEKGFSVSRRYEGLGASRTAFKPGDLIKITLTYTIPATAPEGAYELADYLPSGLRMVPNPWMRGAQLKPGSYPTWPLEVNGQKVSFYAGKKGEPIVYYARVAMPGAYGADPPVLQHQTSGLIFGHGTREQVRIEW